MKNIEAGHQQTRLTAKVKAELKRQIARLYVNKELVAFIQTKILGNSKEGKLALLNFFKKEAQQTYRSPDPDHKTAFEDEYAQEQIDMADEQRFYDPVIWINAEIDYIINSEDKLTTDEMKTQISVMQEAKEKLSKDWLTKNEVMNLFSISRATLGRRLSEGMPAHKRGKSVYFYLEEINNWMKSAA